MKKAAIDFELAHLIEELEDYSTNRKYYPPFRIGASIGLAVLTKVVYGSAHNLKPNDLLNFLHEGKEFIDSMSDMLPDEDKSAMMGGYFKATQSFQEHLARSLGLKEGNN